MRFVVVLVIQPDRIFFRETITRSRAAANKSLHRSVRVQGRSRCDAIIPSHTMSSPEKSPSKRLHMVKGGGEPPRVEEPPGPTGGNDVYCPRCYGTGMEIVPGDGARRCDCKMAGGRERLFRNARIPARYQHCTLANYDAG